MDSTSTALVETSHYIYIVLKDILPSICTIIVAIISSRMVIASANKTLKKENADKLQRDLESFYYPFLLISKKTTELYGVFSKVSSENCDSCILFLLSGNKFEGNALIVFKEIMSNNEKLNNLIITFSSTVSNNTLRNDLSKLSTHYTLLELAYEKQISGNKDVFKNYMFPSRVIENMEIEINRIQEQIRILNK